MHTMKSEMQSKIARNFFMILEFAAISLYIDYSVFYCAQKFRFYTYEKKIRWIYREIENNTKAERYTSTFKR